MLACLLGGLIALPGCGNGNGEESNRGKTLTIYSSFPFVKQLFRTTGRESVLGTYDIDENGDTTLTDYGAYRIRGGELRFNRTIEARATSP